MRSWAGTRRTPDGGSVNLADRMIRFFLAKRIPPLERRLRDGKRDCRGWVRRRQPGRTLSLEEEQERAKDPHEGTWALEPSNYFGLPVTKCGQIDQGY